MVVGSLRNITTLNFTSNLPQTNGFLHWKRSGHGFQKKVSKEPSELSSRSTYFQINKNFQQSIDLFVLMEKTKKKSWIMIFGWPKKNYFCCRSLTSKKFRNWSSKKFNYKSLQEGKNWSRTEKKHKSWYVLQRGTKLLNFLQKANTLSVCAQAVL